VKVFIAGTSFMPAYGGPAYSVPRLAVALSNLGIDVGLWAPDQSAPSASFPQGESAINRLTGSAAEALNAFGNTDVIHDNGLWMRHNHQLSTEASRRHIPRMVSTRGMLEPWAVNHKRFKKRLAWFMYQRRDLQCATGLHTTADSEGAHIERLRLDVPVHVIPNGVDVPDQSRPLGAALKTPRTALFLGRVYPVKGLPMLVEAWARVRPADWRLIIAGPDEAGHRNVVEGAVSAAGLSEVVSFAGPLHGDEKREALLNAELFVLPTHSESFGMAIAEALAHGLPVLTTTGAPWPQLSTAGCGWQVEPTVDGIAGGLLRATSHDQAQLFAMGALGRRLVSAEFGWDQVARRMAAAYAALGSPG